MLTLEYGNLYASVYMPRQLILDKCHTSSTDLVICTCIIFTVVIKIPGVDMLSCLLTFV